jgi:hypothetical protein
MYLIDEESDMTKGNELSSIIETSSSEKKRWSKLSLNLTIMVHAIISHNHNHNHNHNLTIHNHSSHCLYTTHPTLALPYISLPHSLLEEYNEWKIKNLKVQFILFLKNLGLDITRLVR